MSSLNDLNKNIIVDFKKQNLESSQEEEELLTSVKYRLYFLRKSQDLLKPLRPTRGFRNSKEISQLEDELLETYKVYTHTFAYLYISQDNEIKEYKVAYKGEAYNETFLDIYYIDENGLSLNFIPIEKDSEIKISYSNFKLDKNKDKKIIEELNKVTIKPNNIKTDVLKEFYTSNSNDFKFSSLHKDSVYLKEYSKYKPDFINDVNINIFCVIDDILGEIEDLYNLYDTSYKIAYVLNYEYILKIQEQNAYPYTISNILEYFYIDSKKQEKLQRVKEIYIKFVELFLTNRDLTTKFFVETSGDLSKIFEKDTHYIGLNFLSKTKLTDLRFFEDFRVVKHSSYLSDKLNFSFWSSGKIYSYSTKRDVINNIYIGNGDVRYTNIQNNANEVLASIIFTVLFSQEFENDLKSFSIFKEDLSIFTEKGYRGRIEYLDEKIRDGCYDENYNLK